MWCNNQLHFTDPAQATVVQNYTSSINDARGTSKILDFEKIVPYPSCIKDKVQAWLSEINPQENDWISSNNHLDKYRETDIQECGHPTLSAWCNENWGTQWNSSYAQEMDSIFSFTTLDTVPRLVIKKLAELTNVTMTLYYLKMQEMGESCGEYIVQPSGEVVSDQEYTNQMKEFYQDLKALQEKYPMCYVEAWTPEDYVSTDVDYDEDSDPEETDWNELKHVLTTNSLYNNFDANYGTNWDRIRGSVPTKTK
jgi:hypothetical protein